MDLNQLSYVPLDIPVINLDYDRLLWLLEAQGIPHHPYGDIWQGITVLGDIEYFSDPHSCYEGFKLRGQNRGGIRVNNAIPDDILEPIMDTIGRMPYKQCTFAQILSQKLDVPPHQDVVYDGQDGTDGLHGDGAQGEPEPAGLKIMLSHRHSKSFYLMRDSVRSKRDFIRIPDDTSCFAINERRYLHGAKHIGQPKFVVSTFGIIDPDAHRELVVRSITKYPDYAIWY